ncbi:NucA/NucB deoxyribonuclease domain-containing protein [Planosporangium sp. 12N6]|uniref:NucA/NucB deoxyribonuclease domain-containing protein n=1 Tax=Planosporangium spinosum TaxID=3402278 RepID=UPI003CF50EEA
MRQRLPDVVRGPHGILGPPVTKTAAQWSADAGSGSWTSYWVTSNEDVGTITDKVLFHPFVFKATYQDSGTALSSDHFIRCDSADYFAGRPKAYVMWDVVPHLQYRINNTDSTPTDVHAVAEHIKFAFEHPNDTYPRIPGRDKRIPGRYVGNLDNNYLERVSYNSPDRLANSAEKDRACQRTAPCQDTGLPQPPGPGEQCDEFPFASTKQGAASPDWDFSVRAVPTGNNGKQVSHCACTTTTTVSSITTTTSSTSRSRTAERDRRRRPRRLGYVHRRRTRSRCQRSSVPGHTNNPSHNRRGSSRARPARTARSAQSTRGRAT